VRRSGGKFLFYSPFYITGRRGQGENRCGQLGNEYPFWLLTLFWVDGVEHSATHQPFTCMRKDIPSPQA